MKPVIVTFGVAMGFFSLKANGVVRISDHLKDRQIYDDKLCLIVSHEKADRKDSVDSPTRVTTPVACQFSMQASLNLHKTYKDVKDLKKRKDLLREFNRKNKIPYPEQSQSFVIPYQEARLVCFDFKQDLKSLPRNAKIRDYHSLHTACVESSKAGEALSGFKESSGQVFAWKLDKKKSQKSPGSDQGFGASSSSDMVSSE